MKENVDTSQVTQAKAAKAAAKKARAREAVEKDAQQQTLTRAYIGALGVIAVLTVIGHLLTAYITHNQRESAGITFTMTSLLSNIDVIISQSSVYKISGNDLDEDLLNQSINRLKNEYTKIEGHKGDTIDALFHAPPHFLSIRIKNFIDMADQFSQAQSTGKLPEAEASLAVLSGRTSKILKINLDVALQEYHTNVLEQIDRSYKLQYIGALIILGVLFLEATFIFRPLVRRLGKFHRDLLRLALTDELTGLNNRRAFIQQSNAELSAFARTKKPYAIALMDLDKFKLVNDTYGHKVGDLVLQHYAQLMLKSFRGHDIIGRLGGEEFSILLPQTSAEEAMMIIERFRKTVMETPCPYPGKAGENSMLRYTSSFGVVAVTSGVWSLDSLLIKADEGLYKAKDQGRNCTVMTELGEKKAPLRAVPSS